MRGTQWKKAKRLVSAAPMPSLRAEFAPCTLQHKLFIHEKAVLSLGVYGSGPGCIPSQLGCCASRSPPFNTEHRIGILPIRREGAKQQEDLASPVRRFFFFPRIAENVKPPPASSDSSLRASGSRQVLVLPRTLLFLSMPNICGIVVSVRVCVHAYIYVYICINTRVY